MPILDFQNYEPACGRQELILSLGFNERIKGDHLQVESIKFKVVGKLQQKNILTNKQ